MRVVKEIVRRSTSPVGIIRNGISTVCPDAEGYLRLAARKGAIVVIRDPEGRDLFAVKTIGRIVGPPLTEEYGAKFGMFYEPMFKSIQHLIRTAFVDGQSHITVPEGTIWREDREIGSVPDVSIAEIVEGLSPSTIMQDKDNRIGYAYGFLR